ncbi:MAG: hypothetical protein J6C88_06150 [Lachnospiraceae bacterium]|nr:hypothetical protein [Lachnospiraceae bacterium]
MRRKKSKFLTFIFSLLPGAGEMYMGFMKMGVSLMAEFFGIIFLATVTEVSQLLLIDIILWFYAFFHVHSIAGASDEEFSRLEDKYLIPLYESNLGRQSKMMRRFCSIVLIVLGAFMLWNMGIKMLGSILYLPGVEYVPKVLVAVGLIVLGIVMIQGKKEALDQEEASNEQAVKNQTAWNEVAGEQAAKNEAVKYEAGHETGNEAGQIAEQATGQAATSEGGAEHE